ncbi:MAG: serine hydrolase [Actinobacteria bacterium]|nr:serine hydrolase [Actinomycetota bacterium]
MEGFPPPPDGVVGLPNWQCRENVRWAFRHMREIIPTQPISAPPAPRPLTAATSTLPDLPVVRLDGRHASVEEVMADTHTDGIMVLHDGAVVDERYFAGMTASTRHLIMSVSKSLIGCVAGVLSHRGLLDPGAPLTDYVPEAGGCGYRGATVRDVLDMRTGVAFSEAYTDAESEVRAMERSVGWAPARRHDPVGAYAYLATLRAAGAHGGAFTYRSADTDMLGWVCERAAGARMADLISDLIWQPMGAEFDADITCDPVGTATHDGGVSLALRDLARFGQLLADEGMAGERQVVPAAWVADAFAPDPGVRAAFARTEHAPVLPDGWYRSQLWGYHNHGPVLLCLGIHGQLVFVDRAARVVVVKMSSWPDAQDVAHLVDTLRACGAIARALSA